MSGFRFFCSLSVALCLCVSHWGRAHAADAAAPGVRHVAAANVKLEKTTQAQSKSKAAKPQVGATTGQQAKSAATGARAQGGKTAAAKAAKPSPKAKSAAKSATPAPRGKSSAKRRPLPPASADLPQSGIASWVGRYFHDRPVSTSGERHSMESFTAAHRAIAFHTILKVTDMRSGRSVLVRVNDRGPYIRGRIVDLARAAAEYLGYADKGITTVRLELAGHDKDPAQRYYIRMRPSTGAGKGSLVRGFGPFDKFDEAASLFISLHKSYPDAELLAVREKS